MAVIFGADRGPVTGDLCIDEKTGNLAKLSDFSFVGYQIAFVRLFINILGPDLANYPLFSFPFPSSSSFFQVEELMDTGEFIKTGSQM